MVCKAIIIFFPLLAIMLLIATAFVANESINLQETKAASKKMKSTIQKNTTHENDDKRINYLKADGRVRVLLYEECSGSTSVYALSREILHAHGLNVKYYKYGELDDLNNTKDHIYHKAKETAQKHAKDYTKNSKIELSDDSILLEKIRLLNRKARSDNQVLFMKAKYESAYTLSNLTSLFTGIVRRNKLDRAICMVKDCFTTKVGYTIFAKNGTKTSLCFERRNKSTRKLKVKFDKYKLLKFVRKCMKHELEHRMNYEKKLIHPGKIQYYEDLFAFEFTNDDKVLQQSINAWKSLLIPFVDIDKKILRRKLLPLKNSRKYPPPHVESIDKVYQIKKVLRNNKEKSLEYFIRTLKNSSSL